jgi:hypothetical protein
MNRERRIPIDIQTFHPRTPSITVKRTAGIKKGYPSLTIGRRCCSLIFFSCSPSPPASSSSSFGLKIARRNRRKTSRGLGCDLAPSDHGHAARSYQFFNAERFEESEDSIDLLFIPRDLDRVGLCSHVDHLPPEDIDHS